ncbi:MAG: carboxypeptidase-like regulatory domain-containing protein [Gemmataceae bacterium]|nr:carboxypeptidase-like regulatory domain-containing protein [Gemmataceae bacterium]
MQGCVRLILGLTAAFAAGCERAAAPDTPAAMVELGTSFDARATGSIHGQATWEGAVPSVPAFRVHAYLAYASAARLRGEHPNPHEPRIDAASRGVENVVVTLREVQAADSKPWSHPPVRVETDSQRLTIFQGKRPGPIGIVRRGGDVAFVNRDITYHTIRARGAAFFTLPFVAADHPTRRRLDQPGIVELSQGAGVYWRRAYLFVSEHPYAALSDAAGRFDLDRVPAGTYQLTAWLPNWHIERMERDPETAIISRVVFAPAAELTRTVTVAAGRAADVSFVFGKDLFEPGSPRDADSEKNGGRLTCCPRRRQNSRK